MRHRSLTFRRVCVRIATCAGRMVCKTAAIRRGSRASRTGTRALLRAPGCARKAHMVAACTLVFASREPFARAEPLRLRADAVAEARAPAGLLVLQGQDSGRSWLDAE